MSLYFSRCVHSVAAEKFREAAKLDAGRPFRSHAYLRYRTAVFPRYYEANAAALAEAAADWSSDQEIFIRVWSASRKGYLAHRKFKSTGDFQRYSEVTGQVLEELKSVEDEDRCKKHCSDGVKRHSFRLQRYLNKAREVEESRE